MDRTILHCDLNNFYASVECINHPEYRGLPVVVAGNPAKRTGIILAKNYIAKNAGIQTGEVIWKAKQKCPNLICVLPHHEQYAYISRKVKDIYYRFTDRIEPFGLDECWLDVTASTRLFGDGKTIADTIRETVKQETGLTISVGVSFSKMFAKLGSDLKKPDATSVISRENYKTVAWTLPVEALMFVGRHRIQDFQKLNINTIGDLANTDEKLLVQRFGVNGKYLREIARGEEKDQVALYDEHYMVKSVGNGTTAIEDISTLVQAKQVLYYLAESTSARLRAKSLECYTISLSIKDNNLSSFEKSKTIISSTNNAEAIAKVAIELLIHNWDFSGSRRIRALRIKCSNLVCGDISNQMSLFDSISKEKIINKDKSVDTIRQKYGYASLKRANLLNTSLINMGEDDDE